MQLTVFLLDISFDTLASLAICLSFLKLSLQLLDHLEELLVLFTFLLKVLDECPIVYLHLSDQVVPLLKLLLNNF